MSHRLTPPIPLTLKGLRGVILTPIRFFLGNSKYNFSREALISGEGGREEIEGKWAITLTSIVMHIGVINFEREYQPLPPGTKVLVIPQFSYMPD